MRIVKQSRPPRGVGRLLYRVPVLAYRAGLGFLFGTRLLLLRHTGRISGRTRLTVLEVVENDSATGTFVVASGYGVGADWYRNLLETPEATIQVGRHSIPVVALPLGKEEGAAIFVDYASRHPRVAMKLLPRLMGYTVDGSAADFREVGRRLPFVRFVPRN